MKRHIPLVLAALVLAGCEVVPPTPTERIEVIERGETQRDAPREVRQERREATPPRAAREVAFPEDEYARLDKQGSAVVSGRLTLSGQPIPDAGVSVAPVTSYSAEAAEKALAGIAVEPADPRAREYTHTTRTDGNGYFRLAGLPAGEFYVSGAGPDPRSGKPRVVIRQISLGNGQQREVSLSR
ncbi:carboxypeptidase regulatory-like domain-containing protein [Halomonas sp. KAO]|uniref:carboxypeptidase-like regulatory domain-containing protein n=1 Tax=Halomonas sp. KAO TaxID=2783858 RepID=UPI00189E2853|nr:carboxypeptidase-like regulatory domain-containing protein [Halomonas sp. KAO]MBF7054419.1 carboxypeptidase regulatory-like domain-containing protein [Halomonas sp. KAO]